MIKVLIADDHAMVRQSITLLLEEVDDIVVTGQAKSGEEAIQLAKQAKPHVVLMDVRMPGIGGLEAAKRLLDIDSNIRIIGLTGYNDGAYPGLFIRAGALGYITKDTGIDNMLAAIRSVHQGDTYLSSEIAERVSNHRDINSDNPFETLSERELQVSLLLAESYQLEGIAKRLKLTLRTVKSYRYRIFDKLNVQSDVELTLLALRFGMVVSENVNNSPSPPNTGPA